MEALETVKHARDTPDNLRGTQKEKKKRGKEGGRGKSAAVDKVDTSLSCLVLVE